MLWVLMALAVLAPLAGALIMRYGVADDSSANAATQSPPGASQSQSDEQPPTNKAKASTSSPDSTDPADTPEFDREAARQATQRLQKQYQNVVSAEKQPARLLDSARDLVERFPHYVPARKMLGQVLVRGGRKAAGYTEIQTALALANQPRPNLREMAGTLAMELGRYEEALEHFALAAKHKPERPRFRAHKARALIALERFERAEVELKRALKQNSSSYRVHAVLAQLYSELADRATDKPRKQQRLKTARKHIREAIAFLPADKSEQRPQFVRQRAALLRRSGMPAEGVSVLGDLTMEQLFKGELLEEMARCLDANDQTGRAATFYKRALRVRPHDETIAARAAKWAIKAGRYQQAEKHLAGLRRINAHSRELHTLRQKLKQAQAGPNGP